MIPADIVSGIASATWFARPWAPYALLDADLCLVEVNAAFEQATGRHREEVVGRPVFEAFPDNPAAPDADGVANARRSMEHVLRTGSRHWLDFQRYDVPHPRGDGSFLAKIWMAVNAPVLADGRVVGCGSSPTSRIRPPSGC